jgi:hypothetical protein
LSRFVLRIKPEDVKTPWEACGDGGYLITAMYRYVEELGDPVHRNIVLAACDCVEMVLPLVPNFLLSHHLTVKAARDWATHGGTTPKKCADLADTAHGLSLLYKVTPSVNNAMQALGYAAEAVSDPSVAHYAAYRAARARLYLGYKYKNTLADMADIVRARIHPREFEL